MSIHACECRYLQGLEEGTGCPDIGVTGVVSCRKRHSGPLKDLTLGRTILTTEPPQQLHKRVYFSLSKGTTVLDHRTAHSPLACFFRDYANLFINE